MAKRILIVDDEPMIVKGLKYSWNRTDMRPGLRAMAKRPWKCFSRASMT